MTKDILKDYFWLMHEETQLMQELQEWEEKSPSGGNIDGMPRGTDMGDSTAAHAIKAAETKTKLDNKRVEIAEAIMQIEQAIDKLKPQYRVILRGYYIQGQKWEQIAVKTNYSIQHIWRLHGEALKELRKIKT